MKTGHAILNENFTAELTQLINRNCLESDSDTPDFVLALYLTECLAVFGKATRAREQWYGRGVSAPTYQCPECGLTSTNGHVIYDHKCPALSAVFPPPATLVHALGSENPSPANHSEQSGSEPASEQIRACSKERDEFFTGEALSTLQYLREGGKLPEEIRTELHDLTRINIDPAAERAKWKDLDLDSRIEELVKWLRKNGPETARARIHALTRRFTMSDVELANWYPCSTVEPWAEILRDLRDRYEERGKYEVKP